MLMQLLDRKLLYSYDTSQHLFSRYFTPVILGLIYALIYYCVAKKSSAHFNPAISFAYFIKGELERKEFIGYVIAQVLGSITAFGTMYHIFKVLEWENIYNRNAAINDINNIITQHKLLVAVLVELILSFVLIMIFLSVNEAKNRFSGVILGLGIMMVHLVSGSYAFSSMNPARAIMGIIYDIILGKKIYLKYILEQGIFIVVPLIGAFIAVKVYKVLKGKMMAEFVGTAIYIFMAIDVALQWSNSLQVMSTEYRDIYGDNKDMFIVLLVALAFGIGFIVVYYSFGRISGGHFNPITSIVLCIDKQIGKIQCLKYVIAQIFGAICGTGIVYVIRYVLGRKDIFTIIDDGRVSFEYAMVANNLVNINGHVLGGLLAEIFMGFVIVLVILVFSKKDKDYIGFIIGMTYIILHIFGIPYTLASMNPARSIGSAVVGVFAGANKAIEELWIFILGPLVGALLAVLIYKILFAKEDCEE
ncbi:MAG: aquaporin [Lachnospiraceae bacterium]|nr:aquaporin [Lachnospiraceae bacterium]